MKTQIPTRDLENLSAYLDGQLTEGEKARLEARLQREDILKAALLELYRTRNALRAAPRARVRRNFTLTPGMVGQRRKLQPRPYPAFRLVSVIASLLFAFIVVGDLVGMGRFMIAPAVDQATYQVEILEKEEALPREMVEAPAAEAAEGVEAPPAEPEAFALEAGTGDLVEAESESQMDEKAAKSVPVTDETVEATVEAESVGEAAVEETTMLAEALPSEEPAMMKAPPPEEPGEAIPEEIGVEAMQTEGQPYMGTLTPGALPAAGEEIPVASDLDYWADNSMVETQMATPVVEGAIKAEAPVPEPGSDTSARRQVYPQPVWSLLRVVEILLGVVALGTGLMALYYRRQG